MKPSCRVALSCSSWRISSLMSEACSRQAGDRRVKREEDPHALARSVPGLRVLNGLRQEPCQRRNGFFHACLVDSADLLQNRRQGKLFVHEVLVVEDLAQESDKVIVQYPSKSVSVRKLDDVQELIESGLFLLCCDLFEDGSNGRVFEPLKTVSKPLRDESMQARQGFRRQFRFRMPLAPGAERVLPGHSGFCCLWTHPHVLIERRQVGSRSGSAGER